LLNFHHLLLQLIYFPVKHHRSSIFAGSYQNYGCNSRQVTLFKFKNE
jgi:hypothetical protein